MAESLEAAPTGEQLLAAPDVARKFKVHPKTIFAWAASGRLPSVRLGRRCVRFRLEDVERLIRDNLSGATP